MKTREIADKKIARSLEPDLAHKKKQIAITKIKGLGWSLMTLESGNMVGALHTSVYGIKLLNRIVKTSNSLIKLGFKNKADKESFIHFEYDSMQINIGINNNRGTLTIIGNI